MAVAGHQLQNIKASGGGGGGIGDIEFLGQGINNFISASSTVFFFNNFSGVGSTTVYKQGNTFFISGQPATVVNNVSGGSAAIITGLSTSVIARPQATSGLTGSFQATVVDTVLNRSGSTLVWSQTRTNCYEDNSVTFAKFQQISAYTVVGNATSTLGVTYPVPMVFPYDNQQQQYKNPHNGIDEINSVSLYSIISSFTGSNVGRNFLPEYSSYTTFIGTRTLPPNFLVKGKTIRFKGKGYTTTVAGDPNINLVLRLIDTGNTSTILVSETIGANTGGPWGFSLEVDITCREIGSSGLVNANGYFHNNLGYENLLNISNISLDTTKQYYIQLSGNTGSSNSIFALTHTTIEILN